MLAGISKSVQGFSALSRVPSELADIRTMFGGNVLQDEAFVVPSLDAALVREPYSIVHIASHAQFNQDPARTFLLAFDAKLGLERLSEMVGVTQYRSEPIELLTLSACETAAGDDRAALGLAGIAIKAGARSALAGLWFIDDVAASNLVVDFYRQLADPSVSKATALQRAQVNMIGDRRYAHPGYWAPFLMIGNWQ
jgi:CHAT domain-containing protein